MITLPAPFPARTRDGLVAMIGTPVVIRTVTRTRLFGLQVRDRAGTLAYVATRGQSVHLTNVDVTEGYEVLILSEPRIVSWQITPALARHLLPMVV